MSDSDGNQVLVRATDGVLMFFCPGCHEIHGVWTEKPNELTGARWNWNGDMVKPSFTPSILVHGSDGALPRCHSYVTNGTINYCPDSGHALAGQNVILPVNPLEQF